MNDGIFRNTCPRGCYGTCSILSYVENDKLIKVTGDPKQSFTQGKLCAKGYASVQFVYHPKRLKYPMMQQPRGSGNWVRISWGKAYEIIAGKFIELKGRYGSNLATAYNRYHGNIGMLHHAVEGMFNGVGPHTKPIGSPCAMTGIIAMMEMFGQVRSPDPEGMGNAHLIVIWGANPAVTNVHQMKFIYQARRRGATIVCIDPLFTKTTEKADLYIQINAGTDCWLALGIAKIIIEKGMDSSEFLEHHTNGWEEFKEYVTELSLTKISNTTGVSIEFIQKLADLYTTNIPSATWIGLGIQRTRYGGDIIRAISTLVALTGNLFHPDGGIYYANPTEEEFPNLLLHHSGPIHPFIKESRELDIADFASEALEQQDPPIKLLWVASLNPLSQDHNFEAWKELIKQVELFVTVDLFMSKTAEQADIVLPAATQFEEEDLNVSYWHNWVSLNQKAIPPYYEAKSDLQIARELSNKLNELSDGFSNFPAEKKPLDWIREEFTPEMMALYSMTSLKVLFNGPRKRKGNYSILDKNHKFQCFSPENQCDEDKIDHNTELNADSYRLLSPQSLLSIHSQFINLPWLHDEPTTLVFEISPEDMTKHELTKDSKIEVYTDCGSVVGRIKVNPYLPKDVILTNQAGESPVNQIINLKNQGKKGESSTLFYDSIVKVRKWRDTGV